jgi:signal transduction histidine kinase
LVTDYNAEAVLVYGLNGTVEYPSDGLRGIALARPEALDASDVNAIRDVAQDINQPAAVRAMALQRLLQEGETDIGTMLTDDVVRAVDAHGRASGAMVLLGLLQRTTVREGITWSRLAAVATDYSLPLRSSHRRHLLQVVRDANALDDNGLRLLAAEEFTSSLMTHANTAGEPFTIRRTPAGDAWILMLEDARSAIVLGEDTMLRLIATEAARVPGLLGTITLVSGRDDATSLVSMAAGSPFGPDVRLRMTANDETPAAIDSMAMPLAIGLGLLALTVVVSAGALRMTYSRLNLARLRSDLATTVSHELKTPVASTRVLVDTLLDSNLADSAQTREYLELIAKENFRLSRLIENFLLFSRIERGRLSLRREALDPAQLARSAMDTLQDRAIAGERRMEIHTGTDLPLIGADREAMASVLQNLLENAVKHTPEEGGVIGMEVTSLNGHVHFIVRDNGEGIPRDQHRRIFDAFHRVDARLSRSTEGAGLGLSIVRSLVEAHGGHVTVKSDVGSGSTFTITLPAVETSLVENGP